VLIESNGEEFFFVFGCWLLDWNNLYVLVMLTRTPFLIRGAST